MIFFFFFALASRIPYVEVLEVNCAQVKILGKPFRNQRTLIAHPSHEGIGVLSSSMSVAPPSS